MPEYGPEIYSSELEKYKKLGLAGKEEGDDAEPNHEDRDELILEATSAYEAAVGKMSSDIQETFQQILEKVETYYDNDPALSAETLEGITAIMEQLASLTDETEIEERESEVSEEVEQFAKIAVRIENKKSKMH